MFKDHFHKDSLHSSHAICLYAFDNHTSAHSERYFGNAKVTNQSRDCYILYLHYAKFEYLFSWRVFKACVGYFSFFFFFVAQFLKGYPLVKNKNLIKNSGHKL